MEYRSFQTPEDVPVYGEFEIRDLQPGMGTVIGTAMRRTLLASVPGAAPVWMKIKGVCHEFSTVPGVKEDVSQLLLGLRKLVLRVYDRNVHKIALSVKGRDAYAGDFVTDGQVEILNPELPVATIGEQGELSMEVWVQNSRDHSMTESHDRGRTYGRIYMDPVYTPVRKVAVDVDEQPEADHLLLRVWTNGAVSPRAAVDWAGRILRELMNGVEALKSPAPGTEAMAHGIEGMKLEELGLSNRSYNRLKRAHFDTVEELISRSREELVDTPELGPKTVQELEDKLKSKGIYFRRRAHAG